jgi:long-chain fatty acid transport protein
MVMPFIRKDKGANRLKHVCRCLLTFLGILMSSPAWGGGLWLYEQGTPDLGTAAAGRAALAADASTAGANPAGMTRLERSQMLIAAQAFYIESRFDVELATFGGGDGGNAGGFVPSGTLHYVQSISPDWKLGISAGSYLGLGVEYNETWAGRYYTTEAELLTFGVNPGVGYRVNEGLSLGGGFSVLHAQLEQKAAINNSAVPFQAGLADGELKIEADDTALGFNLGVLLEPLEGTRFGITYRSEVDVEFEDVAELRDIGPVLQGLLNLTGLAGSRVDIGMTIPQAVMLSGYHQVNARWALMANIGWQDWSAFGKQDLTLRSTNARTFTQNLDYEDTWHFALGSQYRFAEKWLWSVGGAYDSSPLESDTRTPDAPLDRQIRIGTGVQCDWTKNVTVGAAYEFIDLGKARINQPGGPLQGALQGEYGTNLAHIFAVNLTWMF